MKRLITGMATLWRHDLEIRDVLIRSGWLPWVLVALFVPFGWVGLVFQLEPVRARVPSLRYRRSR